MRSRNSRSLHNYLYLDIYTLVVAIEDDDRQHTSMIYIYKIHTTGIKLADSTAPSVRTPVAQDMYRRALAYMVPSTSGHHGDPAVPKF